MASGYWLSPGLIHTCNYSGANAWRYFQSTPANIVYHCRQRLVIRLLPYDKPQSHCLLFQNLIQILGCTTIYPKRKSKTVNIKLMWLGHSNIYAKKLKSRYMTVWVTLGQEVQWNNAYSTWTCWINTDNKHEWQFVTVLLSKAAWPEYILMGFTSRMPQRWLLKSLC